MSATDTPEPTWKFGNRDGTADHPPGPHSAEITAMEQVGRALEPLDGEARARVIRWAMSAFRPKTYRDGLNG